MPKTKKQLDKIIDRTRNPWSRLAKQLRKNPRYHAAIITRNVRYGSWDVADVVFHLNLFFGIKK